VTLALSDSAVLIQGKNAGSAATQIPYSTITKVGYAFTDRRRVTEGIIIAPVLALTKSQSHWMVIESTSGDAPLVTILRLDKSEYRGVIAAMNARSGKRVEVLDSTSTYVVPTVGSANVDETVPFAFDRVMEAAQAIDGSHAVQAIQGAQRRHGVPAPCPDERTDRLGRRAGQCHTRSVRREDARADHDRKGNGPKLVHPDLRRDETPAGGSR